MPREYDGLYELHLIEEIKIMALNDQLSDERVHEALVGSGDFGDTGETFFTPVVTSLQSDDNNDDEVGNDGGLEGSQMTESMNFEARRAELKYPVTPVMKSERYLFDELIESSRGSSATNENAYTSLDMDRMAREWNDRVEEERRKGKNIYPKTAGLLKLFFTKQAERKNREKALATEVGGTPVSDTIDQVRHSLLQKDRSYSFESVQSEPRPVERDSSKPSAGEVARVPVPPMQVQVGGSEEVRQLVQAEAHVTRPQPQQTPSAGVVRQRKPQRCMRCGKSRTGACHTRTATSNTPEYCKVAEADRTPHWRVPPGYAIGDARQKEKQGATAREWRQICAEKEFVDEGWEGWGSRY